jgi:hypothetical protein
MGFCAFGYAQSKLLSRSVDSLSLLLAGWPTQYRRQQARGPAHSEWQSRGFTSSTGEQPMLDAPPVAVTPRCWLRGPWRDGLCSFTAEACGTNYSLLTRLKGSSQRIFS